MNRKLISVAVIVLSTVTGCGDEPSGGTSASGGAPEQTGGSGPGTGGDGGTSSGGVPSSGGAASGGTGGTAGSGGTSTGGSGGGNLPATGGSGGGSGGTMASGGGITGGALNDTGGSAGSGGEPTGGTSGSGGQSAAGGEGGTETGGAAGTGGQGIGGSAGPCVPTQAWGTADPSEPGPFEVVAETNIGPAAGTPDARWNNEVPHFNLYRPSDLSQGYCHPIVTWANGTGDQPPTYEVLLRQLVSHGFVVVASLSSQTLSGNPLPQVAGVDWMLEENENPDSVLYHRLDTSQIGATGHSQGGAATVAAAVADPRITAIAPIAGAYPLGAPVPASTTISGPAALLCGGLDDIIPCSLVSPAFDNINDVPVMLGENFGDNHGSWIGSIKNPYMIAVTGWMRVHLMGDAENRGMFYGPNCTLCQDTEHWRIERKSMDE